MFQNILTNNQKELLPLLKLFNDDFCLVEGTAVALHIGHRYSIDFDLFTNKKLKPKSIKNKLKINNLIPERTLYEDFEQIHFIINSVKVTFFSYPYNLFCNDKFDDFINIPSLLDLSAMKALALGGRAKWKDYVDLFFLLKFHLSLTDITNRAKEMFGSFFNEKLFREQLTYFKDIDYSEDVAFLDKKVTEKEIKEFLTELGIKKIK